MDFKRIATAVIGLPLVILVFVLGNKYIIDIVCAIIAILCMYEYLNAFKGKARPIKWISYLSAGLISTIHIIPSEYIINIISLSIPIILVILFLHIIISNMKINLYDIMITFLGICYITVFTVFVPIVKGMENGTVLLWYIFISAWGTDIFAYLIGKNLGKHKFSKVSPNKSIEGCVGGALGATILGLIYTYCVNNYIGIEISYIYTFFMTIGLSVISQIGDFSASVIKRYVDIKDYGDLIPGHGGMLDRIDSVIFIAPFAYLLLSLI